MQLFDHLKKRAAAGKPIRVGLVGCGQEGSGFVHVTHQMAGMETAAIADIDVSRPVKTLHDLGIPDSAILVTNAVDAAEVSFKTGQPHFIE